MPGQVEVSIRSREELPCLTHTQSEGLNRMESLDPVSGAVGEGQGKGPEHASCWERFFDSSLPDHTNRLISQFVLACPGSSYLPRVEAQKATLAGKT